MAEDAFFLAEACLEAAFLIGAAFFAEAVFLTEAAFLAADAFFAGAVFFAGAAFLAVAAEPFFTVALFLANPCLEGVVFFADVDLDALLAAELDFLAVPPLGALFLGEEDEADFLAVVLWEELLLPLFSAVAAVSAFTSLLKLLFSPSAVSSW